MAAEVSHGNLNSHLVASFPLETDGDDVCGEDYSEAILCNVSFPVGLGVRSGRRAAMFDGSSHIVVPDRDTLHLDTFTLAAWVKCSSEVGGNWRILEKGASNAYWLYLTAHAGPVVGFYGGGMYHDVVSGVPMIPSRWTFVAGTFDGSTLTIFVDGTLAQFNRVRARPSQNKEPLVLGWKHCGIPSDHLRGALSNVMIFNRALSTEEITSLELKEFYNNFNLMQH